MHNYMAVSNDFLYFNHLGFPAQGFVGAKEANEGFASPTAPVLAKAVCHGFVGRCLDLPITPEKILSASKGV